MFQNYTIYSNPLLSQSKRGYTGFALIKRSNCAFGRSIQALYSQYDRTVSGKPEFKKAISEGSNGLIHKDIAVLVNGLYIKISFGQFPLTGGHVMNRSPVRPIYVWSDCHDHLLFW